MKDVIIIGQPSIEAHIHALIATMNSKSKPSITFKSIDDLSETDKLLASFDRSIAERMMLEAEFKATPKLTKQELEEKKKNKFLLPWL